MSAGRNVCTCCGQVLPERRGRTCSVCDKPIRLHDKWLFVGSSVQHRDCSNPQMYPAGTKTTQSSLLEQ